MQLEREVLIRYEKAGEVVHRVLKKALEIVSPGIKVIEICEALEKEIVSLGAEPAFPVNVSINQVAAHYTAGIGDRLEIPRGGLVKVDVGAHVDGYIADAAITITLSDSYSYISKTTLDALETAMGRIRHGISTGDVGRVVEKLAKTRGLKPISNLSGHKIARYELHAGKSVPNVPTLIGAKMVEGEVYAIEPFLTDGKGYVVEGENGHIYRLVSTKRIKEKRLDKLLRTLWSRFRTLPFAERWAARLGAGISDLEALVRARNAMYYPRLLEAGGGMVAQFENTVIVTEKGVINLTKVEELFK